MTEQVTGISGLVHGPSVEITVNRTHVRMSQNRATGRQIKEAAIAEGVPIELDFQLALVHGNERIIIGDTDEVELHNGDRFVATAGDDNS